MTRRAASTAPWCSAATSPRGACPSRRGGCPSTSTRATGAGCGRPTPAQRRQRRPGLRARLRTATRTARRRPLPVRQEDRGTAGLPAPAGRDTRAHRSVGADGAGPRRPGGNLSPVAGNRLGFAWEWTTDAGEARSEVRIDRVAPRRPDLVEVSTERALITPQFDPGTRFGFRGALFYAAVCRPEPDGQRGRAISVRRRA